MKLKVAVVIEASLEDVWRIVIDIDGCQHVIRGIEAIEVLEKPKSGLVGLKWRETRTLFGKTATEVMWITDAVENSYYETRAESHGAVYKTRVEVRQSDKQTELSYTFSGQPVSLGARVASFIFSPLMTRATRKALQQDLEDIKHVCEE